MIIISILVVLFITLAITTVWFSKDRKAIINSHLIFKKYFAFGLGVIILLFVTFTTVYFDNEQSKKIKEFDKLKVLANMLDTSFHNEMESQTQPTDFYSLDKIDSIIYYKEKSDSLNRELKSIKKYLLSENIFLKLESDFKDSINSTIQTVNNLQANLQKTSVNLNVKSVPIHGFVYAGNINAGKWNQNNFNNLTNNNDSLPLVGDTLQIVRPIFVRIGETHYQHGKGWINQPLKGTLNAGNKIIVSEVVKLPRDYYWIRF